jgi:Type II secretion system (T2SS), protein M
MFERLRNIELPDFKAPAWLRRRLPRVERITRPFKPWLSRVREWIAPVLEASRGWYEKREPREKQLLRILALLVGAFLLYDLIYSPIVEYRTDLAQRVVTRRNDLLEVRGLVRTYSRLKAQVEIAQRRTLANGRDFSLFSVVEQTLTRAVGRDRIGSLTPTDRVVPGGFRQYTVEVKLNNISLAQIVDSLYGVQSLPLPVTVSDLQIHQHARDTHSFDVELTCAALGKDA